MIFEEYRDKYGDNAARTCFGLTDHLVLTVYPGSRVVGRCGRWIGSEPLANTARNPSEEIAIQRLRDSLAGSFTTEEIVRSNCDDR